VATALRMQPADQVGVRRNNLSLVLRLLHERGSRSRAAVAAETGLNKATVSSLVAELIERRLVQEVGTEDARRLGRPATLLELDGRSVACVGVELNVDFIEILATDLAGRPLFERSVPVDTAGRPSARTMRALTALTRLALDAISEACPTIAGITVAVPGLVDVDARAVTLAPNLHWHDLDIGAHLAGALGVDVTISVDNDGNLSALAEYRVGHYAGTPNLIAITGQTGVGGGIVMEGRLLRGAAGFSGEVGHMHLAPDGPRCGCGRIGCWEALVGLKPLLRRAVPDLAAALEADESLGPEQKVRHIVARAQADDPVALAALVEHGGWLGDGLSILVNLFNPQVVVLGGFFRDLAPWVLPVAEARVMDLTIAPRAGGCRLAVSTLGFSAASLGGAIHAAERVFDDPGLVEIPRP
jgi:predicted NBD/HSP70 family sugar kinase